MPGTPDTAPEATESETCNGRFREAGPARPDATASETYIGRFRESDPARPGASAGPKVATVTFGADPARPGASAYCSCGAWWTGSSRAHCPACHITCSSDTAAGRHRRGRFGIDRRCIDPAEAGLIPTARPYGTLWSLPGAAAPHWDRDAE